MIVTRFLERKWVIQFFGVALILAPFFNIFFQLLFLKAQQNLSWGHIDLVAFLLNANILSYILAIASISIGFKMIGGSIDSWKYVLGLLGVHLALQLVNYKSKVWQTPLAWTAFAMNTLIFLFIADQLVFKTQPVKKVEPIAAPIPEPVAKTILTPMPEIKTLHLKSYKKIMFSFYSEKPWGRLMTLTSHQLVVNCFTTPPPSIEEKTVQISFTKDLVIDIQFDKKENNLFYFTPLNMSDDKVHSLNTWLKKIAV